jgi:hypothetical protein
MFGRIAIGVFTTKVGQLLGGDEFRDAAHYMAVLRGREF